MSLATFAAGCFWGVEDYFMKLNGVISTVVGYEGGSFDNPTYKDVCTNSTGHAEVLQLEYDENIISFKELLGHFFDMHDPTTINKQGPDEGSQYRSAIFFHDVHQKNESLEYISMLNKSNKFKNKIVTEVTPHTVFFRAEDYHQKYFLRTGEKSCHI